MKKQNLAEPKPPDRVAADQNLGAPPIPAACVTPLVVGFVFFSFNEKDYLI